MAAPSGVPRLSVTPAAWPRAINVISTTVRPRVHQVERSEKSLRHSAPSTPAKSSLAGITGRVRGPGALGEMVERGAVVVIGGLHRGTAQVWWCGLGTGRRPGGWDCDLLWRERALLAAQPE